jgi:hypothetical protein
MVEIWNVTYVEIFPLSWIHAGAVIKVVVFCFGIRGLRRTNSLVRFGLLRVPLMNIVSIAVVL